MQCLLEGEHLCVVKFKGSTAFGSGTWVGIELDAAAKVKGRTNGSIGGQCASTI